MTMLAKIEANQRNGEFSTGPRTVEEKVIVSRNATKHGIFGAMPVIPGECPANWEAHRTGVVDSLAPVGLLEVSLAKRAALSLWRLQRLARYEAESLADGKKPSMCLRPHRRKIRAHRNRRWLIPWLCFGVLPLSTTDQNVCITSVLSPPSRLPQR